MTLLEKFDADGIFSSIAKIKETPAINLDNAEKLDAAFMVYFGDRILYKKYESMPVSAIAGFISLTLRERWDKLYEVNGEYSKDVTGYSQTITETSKSAGTNQNDTTEKSVDTISAYNDDSLKDNSGDNKTTTNQGKEENTRDKTTVKTGFNAGHVTELNSLYNSLRNNNLYGTIMREIVLIVSNPICDN